MIKRRISSKILALKWLFILALEALSFAAHLQIDEENKHYIEAKKRVVYNLLIKKAIHLYFPSRMVIL